MPAGGDVEGIDEAFDGQHLGRITVSIGAATLHKGDAAQSFHRARRHFVFMPPSAMDVIA